MRTLSAAAQALQDPLHTGFRRSSTPESEHPIV
jgi:hypothetical protein